MKRILTKALGPYAETVPTGTGGWIAPEGNRLWTPQQNVIIVAVDMSVNLNTYNSTLVNVGEDHAILKIDLGQSSSQQVDGQIAQLTVGVGTSLQGALTNSGPTFPMHANKYVPFPDNTGQLILENTDWGVWVWRDQNTGADSIYNAMVYVHYILQQGGNI